MITKILYTLLTDM